MLTDREEGQSVIQSDDMDYQPERFSDWFRRQNFPQRESPLLPGQIQIEMAERLPPRGALAGITEKSLAQRLPFVGPAIDWQKERKFRKLAEKVVADTATQEELYEFHRQNTERQAEAAQKRTWGHSVTSIAADQPGFMTEFLVSDILLSRFPMLRAAKWTGGIGARAAKTALRALPQALIGGAPRIAEQYEQRMTPDVYLRQGERGLEPVQTQPAEKSQEALLKSLGSMYIEFLSERLGGALNEIPLPNAVKKIKEAASERLLSPRNKEAAKAFNDFMRRAGYHGVPEELFEEAASEVMHWAANIEDYPYDLRTQEGWEKFLQQRSAEAAAFALIPAARTVYAKTRKAKGEDIDRVSRPPAPPEPEEILDLPVLVGPERIRRARKIPETPDIITIYPGGTSVEYKGAERYLPMPDWYQQWLDEISKEPVTPIGKRHLDTPRIIYGEGPIQEGFMVPTESIAPYAESIHQLIRPEWMHVMRTEEEQHDREDQRRMEGAQRDRQEPWRPVQEQGRGEEEVAPGGILQAQEIAEAGQPSPIPQSLFAPEPAAPIPSAQPAPRPVPPQALVTPQAVPPPPPQAVMPPPQAVIPPPQAVMPPPRAVVSPPGAVTPPTQAVTPPTQAITPPTQAVTPPTQAVTPPPQAITPPQAAKARRQPTVQPAPTVPPTTPQTTQETIAQTTARPEALQTPQSQQIIPGLEEFNAIIDQAIVDLKRARRKNRPTPGDIVIKTKNISKEVVKEAFRGLDELFGGGRIGIVPQEFSEDAWKRAKPHFDAAWQALKDAGMEMRDFILATVSEYGEAVRPYLNRWIAETLGQQQQQKQIKPPPRHETPIRQAIRAIILGGDAPIKQRAAVNRLAKEHGLEIKNLEEEYERVLVDIAKGIAANPNEREAFDNLINLYKKQMSLTLRTLGSIELQQYSTPVPLAFAMSRIADVKGSRSIYEPTAGNGALLIEANPESQRVDANEIDSGRARHLREQGYNVTENNALTYVPAQNSYDVVLANPPFGSIPKIEIDGYMVGKKEYVIAINALKGMKRDGRAVFLFGASSAVQPEKTSQKMSYFMNWLYATHHVVGDVGVAGRLYARQGASYPVRLVVVAGRRETPLAKEAYAHDIVKMLNTWEDVYNFIGEMKNAIREIEAGRAPVETRAAMPDRDIAARGQGPGEPGRVPGDVAAGNTQDSQDNDRGGPDRIAGPVQGHGGAQHGVGAGPGQNKPDVGRGTAEDVQRDVQPVHEPAAGVSEDVVVRDDRLRRADQAGREGTEGGAGEHEVLGRPVLSALAESVISVPYTPGSRIKAIGALVPRYMADAIHKSMSKMGLGNIEEYVSRELDYAGVEEMEKHLSAEQADAIAMAIYQHRRGKSLIVADQTGMGKGRVAAAIMYWAHRNGYIPVFFTEGANLFTDIWRDMTDIDRRLRPFVIAAPEEGTIKNKDGSEAFKAMSVEAQKAAMRQMMEAGRFDTDKYDVIFIPYTQIQDHENTQVGFLKWLSNAAQKKIFFVLDEAHKAAGSTSLTGAIFTGEKYIHPKTRHSIDMAPGLINSPRFGGILYMSATWAKEIKNMRLYFKTDISDAAKNNIEWLQNLVLKGGIGLQRMLSMGLAEAGQLIRRELDYGQTTLDTIKLEENAEARISAVDNTTRVLRSILMFSTDFVDAVKRKLKQIKATSNIDVSLGLTEFANIAHNQVQQMILASKAEDAASAAIKIFQQGEKPIIVLHNTMEAAIHKEGATQGQKIDASFKTILFHALESTITGIETNPVTGKKKKVRIEPDFVDMKQQYEDILADINALDIDLPGVPIDTMIQRLQSAGIKVGEITGRTMKVHYTGEGYEAIVQQREIPPKNSVIRAFNNGDIDALIINASGSTGISLHARPDVADQRTRHMLIVQPPQDIVIFMQTIGRIFRAGMIPGSAKFSMMLAPLSSEFRQMAILARKLKSLNANTTANTESILNIDVEEIFNKYGDEVVMEYLSNDIELQHTLGMHPVRNDKGRFEHNNGRVAVQFTGRLALLPDATQNGIYEDVIHKYREHVQFLKENGLFDIDIEEYPDWDAVLLEEQVLSPAEDPDKMFMRGVVARKYDVMQWGTMPTLKEIMELRREHMTENPYKFIIGLLEEIKALPSMTVENWRNTKDILIDLANNVGNAFEFRKEGETVYGALVAVKYRSGGRVAPSKLDLRFRLLSVPSRLNISGAQFLALQRQEQGVEAGGILSVSPTNESISSVFPTKRKGKSSRTPRYVLEGNPIEAYIYAGKGAFRSFVSKDRKVITGLVMPEGWNTDKLELDPRYIVRSGEAIVSLSKNMHTSFVVRGYMFPLRIYKRDEKTFSAKMGDFATSARILRDHDLQAITGQWYRQSGEWTVSLGAKELRDFAAFMMEKHKEVFIANKTDFKEEQVKKANEEGSKPPEYSIMRIATEPMLDVEEAKEQIEELESDTVDVQVVQSTSDVPERLRRERMQGVWDRDTNTIWLVAGNIPKEIDGVPGAYFVLLHEMIGHRGIEGVVADLAAERKQDPETLISEFYDSIAESRKADIIKHAQTIPSTPDHWRAATKEWLADTAASGKLFNPGIWDKVKDIFRRLFAAITGRKTWSDAALRELVLMAYAREMDITGKQGGERVNDFIGKGGPPLFSENRKNEEALRHATNWAIDWMRHFWLARQIKEYERPRRGQRLPIHLLTKEEREWFDEARKADITNPEIAARRDRILTAIYEKLLKKRTDYKWYEPLLFSIANYSRRIPAARMVFEAALRYSENRTIFEGEIIDDPDGASKLARLDAFFTKHGRKMFRKSDEEPSQAELLQEYIIARDEAGVGYRAEEIEGIYRIIDLDGEVINGAPTFHDEDKAWEYVYRLEAEDLRKNGFPTFTQEERLFLRKFENMANPTKEQEQKRNRIIAQAQARRRTPASKETINALLDYREIMHQAYNHLMRQTQEHMEEMKRMGLPAQKIELSEGSGASIDLFTALRRMGDLRGSFFPRLRTRGQYMLWAYGAKGNPRLEIFEYKIARLARAATLRKEGWTVHFSDVMKVPDIGTMEINIITLNDVINNAMKRIEASDVLENINISIERVEGDKKAGGKVVLRKVPHYLSDVMELFEGVKAETKDGGEWHFFVDKPAEFEKKIKDAINKKVLGEIMPMQMFSMALAANIAQIFQERGSRATRIPRRSPTEALYKGYVEDVLLATTMYVRGIAAGTAKGIMAKEMITAFTGTHLSWKSFLNVNRIKSRKGTPEYKNELRARYKEWLKYVDEMRIDGATQPNAYRDTKEFISEMLRDDTPMERRIGVIRGLAAIKYLTGLSAGLVNATALFTAAPAAMKGFAGVPIHKTLPLLAMASNKYVQYMLYTKFGIGKKPSDRDLVLFGEIRARGWDHPQYNKEAIAAMKGMGRRRVERIIDVAMFPFTVTEQINRAATIAATYYWLAGDTMPTGNVLVEFLKKGKLVSDKAHAVYGKENIPAIARGGGLVQQLLRSWYMFKAYSHNILQIMAELGFERHDFKAVAWLWLSHAILAGPQVMLGKSVIFYMVRAMLSAFGPAPDDPEEALYDWLEETFGGTGRRLGRAGVAGLFGLNIKGSLSIDIEDEFMPTTLRDLLGAPGSVIKDYWDAGTYAARGDLLLALEKSLPRAVAGVPRAIREKKHGVMTRSNKPLFYGDEQLRASWMDAVIRALSFNPVGISTRREEQYAESQIEKKYADRRIAIYQQVRDFINDKDRTKAQWVDILSRIERYNADARRSQVPGIPLIDSDSLRQVQRDMTTPPKREQERHRKPPEREMPDIGDFSFWEPPKPRGKPTLERTPLRSPGSGIKRTNLRTGQALRGI